ncbi:hypothetical protein HID58_068311 [Brassica napus]|uniref:ABC transporter domain-containing protein n=3 Tax=Brassica TaxID=3705 RepID=A0ABQ7ZL26_BRANA|nr:hypothetical protein HID58_068311 [Brassica napus]CDY23627.1 BnaC05g39670D [Brassica napus]
MGSNTPPTRESVTDRNKTSILMQVDAFPREGCMPEFNVSYKPQGYDWKREYAMRSLQIEALLDQAVNKISGGERQRVFITLCLGKPADIYLIDEPSAHLDSSNISHLHRS